MRPAPSAFFHTPKAALPQLVMPMSRAGTPAVGTGHNQPVDPDPKNDEALQAKAADERDDEQHQREDDPQQ